MSALVSKLPTNLHHEEENESNNQRTLQIFVLRRVQPMMVSNVHLRIVSTYVIGIDATNVVTLYASWRIEIFQAVFSNPKLSTI